MATFTGTNHNNTYNNGFNLPPNQNSDLNGLKTPNSEQEATLPVNNKQICPKVKPNFYYQAALS